MVSIRFAKPEYLIDGKGSQLHGGRWNPVGLAAVYGCTSPEVALAETLRHHRYYNMPDGMALPRLLCAIRVELENVLPLTDSRVRSRLRMTKKSMCTEDWRKTNVNNRCSDTQLIGRAAHELGLQGLLVPSAASPSGQVLALFPENGAHLRILNEDEFEALK